MNIANCHLLNQTNPLFKRFKNLNQELPIGKRVTSKLGMSMNGRTVSFLPRHHDSLPTGFVPANIIPRIGLIRKAIKRIQRVILNKIQHIRLDPFTHALANRPGMYDIQQTIHKTFISGNHTRSQVKIFLQYLIHTILLFYRIQTYTISKLLACVYILTSQGKKYVIFL